MQPTLQDLEVLARQAGAILYANYARDFRVDHKGVIDLVTEVDRQSEALLLEKIHSQFPGHSILAEETGSIPRQEEHIWYVDPLDGTINYAHGIPIFCVSIAYAHAGEVKLGVIYDPMRQELFAAARGGGARLNQQPIHVSKINELKNSLLVTGFPYDTWSTPRNNLSYFGRFARLTQGVRRLGSAALDLCYVAAGRFDGYWELALNAWDIAAGTIIAEEAGARVTDLAGNPHYMQPPYALLAAPPGLHAQMLEVLQNEASPDETGG